MSTTAPSSSPLAPPRSGGAASASGARFFLWVLAAAFLARLWRAVGLWQEADAGDGFAWLPLGLAADVLMGLVVFGLVVVVARRAPRAAVAWGALLGLLHVAWLGVNLVSFTLTQAPITFQRARGDEGVALDAHALLRFEDVVPAIAFAVFALTLLPLAWRAGPRLVQALGPRGRRVVAVVALVAVVAYAGDALVWRKRNFGVADHPVLTLASSFALGAFEERRRPVLDAALKKRMKAQAGRDSIAPLLVARTPTKESAPPPTHRAELKNVIVFFAEGVARKHTGLADANARTGGKGTTPHLARRARESGLELTRYHSTYHKSIAAIFSLVCADYPPAQGTNIVEINARIDCGEMSTVLHASGLRMGLFHGGDFGFYDKLMLLGMRDWEITEDARVMSDPLVYEENEWGIDDRATVDNLLAWIDTLPPDERFGALLIPITAHWPYWIPSDVEPLLPPISSKNNFLNAVHFLDEVFERLMVGLEERGLAHDTAVVYLADHGETVGERPRASAGRRLAYEPSLHVPFVILAPGMWPAGATSDRLGSHVDLLPTIMDVLALPADPRHRGTSLLAPDRDPSRVFIGASNGFRLVGWLDGDHKYIVNQSTGAREAYDLARDPDERRNIVDALSSREVEQLEQDALAFAEAQNARLKSAPRVDAELDIEGLYLDAVDVRIERAGEIAACPRVPGDAQGRRACPGESDSVFQGRVRTRAGDAKHDCILVSAPANGVLELEVVSQPWLPLITRVRVAQTDAVRPGGDPSTYLAALSDGESEGGRMLQNASNVRVTFASPRSSLLLRIGGRGASDRDVCITLSERGWRNRPLAVPASPASPAAPAPPASPASPTSPTSPTWPTSLTSPMSPASPESPASAPPQ